MRFPHRMADRIPHDLRLSRDHRRTRGEKLVLGSTFVIITIIAGQEMSHLVHPVAALIAMAVACASGAFAGMT